MKFSRITVDPGQIGGVPCIRKLRIPVATIIGHCLSVRIDGRRHLWSRAGAYPMEA